MSKSARIFGVIAFVSMGLCFVQFTGYTSANRAAESDQFSRKVNLALRRTAHHLLRHVGDDTSRIAPVKQQAPHTFLVHLNRSFDYSQLPTLLQESFRVYDIRSNYDVAILDCARGEVQLGYNSQDLLARPEVPCRGRRQIDGCYNLKITFSPSETASPLPSMGWIVALGVLMAGFGYVVWRKANAVKSAEVTLDSDKNESRLVRFGDSSLDLTTQTLLSGLNRHSLTYRETKLLRFFIGHANQILPRDLILKSVWEDEGVIVGRSVDVFVSRLRKLLQDDPTVRIVAVHGVGYRLEVQ